MDVVDDRVETIILSSKTLAGDLRDFLLDRLKHDHEPLPWQMRGEAAQRETIAQVEGAVRIWVHRAVALIAADGHQTARGSLVKLMAKDSLQFQVNIAPSDPMRHKLLDAVGSSVLLTLIDADQFLGERAPVKVSKDQGDILDDADDDNEPA